MGAFSIMLAVAQVASSTDKDADATSVLQH
jgi:hypothetical protein